jgi:hypothetical protein
MASLLLVLLQGLPGISIDRRRPVPCRELRILIFSSSSTISAGNFFAGFGFWLISSFSAFSLAASSSRFQPDSNA